jgi:hypothetical protein
VHCCHAVAKEARWLRLLMLEFGQGDESVVVVCGNAGCIADVKIQLHLHMRST